MRTYYDILGLPSFEGSQDVILSAYRAISAHLLAEKDFFYKEGSEARLIIVNEAFLVLSDKDLKEQYDYCLRSNTVSEEIKKAISAKRQRAEEFAHNKFSNIPKKRKKRIWPAILCGLFIFSAFGTLVKTCAQAAVLSSEEDSEKVGIYQPNESWSEYEIANAFTISVPPTMELRHEYDQYTQLLQHNNLAVSNAEAVFQQADLSTLSKEAYGTYCRIMIAHYDLSPNDVEHHYETSYINQENRKDLKEIIDVEVEPWTYVQFPTYQWIDIDGTKAIEAKYKRNGAEGPVVCRLYLLSNYDELVKMIVAYRESDSDKWAVDMNNIIRTFHWNNPK